MPKPRKFGESDEVILPKTEPRAGVPEGAEKGADTGKGTQPPLTEKPAGPLPFLSQNDIDQLARKGMPEKQSGR